MGTKARQATSNNRFSRRSVCARIGHAGSGISGPGGSMLFPIRGLRGVAHGACGHLASGLHERRVAPWAACRSARSRPGRWLCAKAYFRETGGRAISMYRVSTWRTIGNRTSWRGGEPAGAQQAYPMRWDDSGRRGDNDLSPSWTSRRRGGPRWRGENQDTRHRPDESRGPSLLARGERRAAGVGRAAQETIPLARGEPDQAGAERCGEGSNAATVTVSATASTTGRSTPSTDSSPAKTRIAARRTPSSTSGVDQFVDPRLAQTSIDEWIRAWSDAHHVSSTTWATYDSHIRNHILPRWSGTALGDIQRMQVKGWVNKPSARSLATRPSKTSSCCFP